MELIDGEPPLHRALARGRLTPAEALRIAVAVVDALAVPHRRGIIHRDLKPSNIFVTSTGVRVLDFGLARSIEPAQTETALAVTQTGVFVGTPQYAAPEQLTGATIDPRADLFSAAVILFEMLAGRPPFSGATLTPLIHSVLYDTPPVLTGSAAVTATDRILHRALSKKPEERYPTVSSSSYTVELFAVPSSSHRGHRFVTAEQ